MIGGFVIVNEKKRNNHKGWNCTSLREKLPKRDNQLNLTYPTLRLRRPNMQAVAHCMCSHRRWYYIHTTY